MVFSHNANHVEKNIEKKFLLKIVILNLSVAKINMMKIKIKLKKYRSDNEHIRNQILEKKEKQI